MSTLELLVGLIKQAALDVAQRAVFLKEFRHRVVHSSNGELVFHIFRAADKRQLDIREISPPADQLVLEALSLAVESKDSRVTVCSRRELARHALRH